MRSPARPLRQLVKSRRSTHHRRTTPFDAFDIVAGHHRYHAALAMKWKTINCIIVDFDDLHAELAEIDENLIRSPLTPAQEAESIFRRKGSFGDDKRFTYRP